MVTVESLDDRPEMTSSNGTGKVADTSVIFLYEKNSGEIRHRHSHCVVQGTKLPSKELIEEEAFKIAKEKGLDTSELAALHVKLQKI